MKIGNHTIKLDPHIEQDFPIGKGRISAIGKDKRYPEFYGKYYWFILVKYQNGNKEVFTFDLKDNCIESKKL